jgi:TonB family protein
VRGAISDARPYRVHFRFIGVHGCKVWSVSDNIAKALATIILFLVPTAGLRAQEAKSDDTHGHASVVKLSSPVYPPIAKQTRITGDVRLNLIVRADGSVESVTVESGHPLLKRAALDSAQQSQFDCERCGKEVRSVQMVYSFQLGPTVYCTGASSPPNADKREESYPRVMQAENHITVIDQPVGTCDLAFKITEKKVRSIKCMYLWKCGLADWHEEPLNGPQ